MPYRLYAATGRGWSASPVDFECADKALECAFKMIKRRRLVEVEPSDLSAQLDWSSPPASRMTPVSYRFYEMATSGTRCPPQDSDCSSDIEAMMRAGEMMKADCSVEVWHGNRFVGEIGHLVSRWSLADASAHRPNT